MCRRKEAEERREVPCHGSATAKEAAAARGDKNDKQQRGSHRAGAATSGQGLQSGGTSEGCRHQRAYGSSWEQGAVLLLVTQFFSYEFWRSWGHRCHALGCQQGSGKGSQVAFRGRTESRGRQPKSLPPMRRGCIQGGCGDTESDAKAKRAEGGAVPRSMPAACWVHLSHAAPELGSFPSSCPTSPDWGGGS